MILLKHNNTQYFSGGYRKSYSFQFQPQREKDIFLVL